ncbi:MULTISPECIES: M48 family metalloprotease [unclassified Streptomyces]|uniref:M48 family metalloprotease n=1 Tax=unclassified Streptomyces TaxID=2593676 RepID=UPI0036FB3031
MTAVGSGEPALETLPPPRRPLPSGTLLAFVLLICAVLSFLSVLHPGYADVIAGDRGGPDLNSCLRDAVREAGGTARFLENGPRPKPCDSSDDRTSQGILVSYAILVAATAAHYWFRSARRARRRGVRPLDAGRFPSLHAEITRLTAGAERARGVTVLVDFLDSGVNGVTFGRAGRRHIILSRGLIRLHEGDAADRAAFRAVVLHEVAHLRNRDVDITLITLALLRCWFALLLFPRMLGDLVGLLFVPGSAPYSGAALLDAAAFAAVALAARSVILRTREFRADARVVEWMGTPEPLLRAFGLASAGPGGRPRRSVRGWWARFTRTHPSFAQRRDCLADQTLLMHQGFGFAFVVGFCLPVSWDPVASVTAQVRQNGGIRGWWPTWLITLLVVLVLLLTVVRAALHRLDRRAAVPSPVPFRLGVGLGVLAGFALSPTAIVDHLMLPGLRVSLQFSGWLVVAVLALMFTVWCQFLGDCWARSVDLARRPVRMVAVLGLVVAGAVVGEADTVFGLQWEIEFGQFMDERLSALPGPVHAAVWTQYVYMTRLVHPWWLLGLLALLLGVPLAGAVRGWRLSRYMVAERVRPARRALLPALGATVLTAVLLPPAYTWWARVRGLEALAYPQLLTPVTVAAAAGVLAGGLARTRGTAWAVTTAFAVGVLLSLSLPRHLWGFQLGVGIEGAVLGTLLTAALPRGRGGPAAVRGGQGPGGQPAVPGGHGGPPVMHGGRGGPAALGGAGGTGRGQGR